MSPLRIKEELAEKSGAFVITLSDGRTFQIEHTDYILLSPDGEHTIFYASGQLGHKIIDTRHITSIEFSENQR
jgi:hypothetical protein